MSNHIQSFTEVLIGTVLKDMFPRYRGKTIQKLSEKEYSVFGRVYATEDEAKKQIDETYKALYNSIK